jgi:hypothetical protein
MKRPSLTLAVIAGMIPSPPAQACHIFSRWYYPWPQHCAAEIVRTGMPHPTDLTKGRPPANTPSPPIDERTWFVEILRAPDDIEREEGIAKLRGMLAQ